MFDFIVANLAIIICVLAGLGLLVLEFLFSNLVLKRIP